MKPTPASSFLRRASFALGLCAAAVSARAQYFSDNFSSYAVGGSLAPNWTSYYNGAYVADGTTVSGSDGNILRVPSGSNYAGYAFRAVSFAQSFRLEADIYATTSNGPIIDLWHGIGDASPYYRMFTMLNGNFYQGDAVKQQVGAPQTWTTGAWHHIAIDYVRLGSAPTATLTYYYDGAWLGQVTTPGATPWDTSTHYLALANNFNGTTYFDNVSIAVIPESAVVTGVIGVMALVGALWRRRLACR